MKTLTKRRLGLLLCLAILCSLLPVGAQAADMTRVYCQSPDDWTGCLVYWWGVKGQPQWPGVPMEQDEKGIWFYDVPTNAEGLIFNNGDGKKTGDLRVPTDEYVMFVYEKHFWSRYGEPDTGALYIVAGFGSLCGSSWDPGDRNNRMTDEDGDGIYTKTYENVASGTYELKVTTGSWSKTWGDPEKGSNYILNVPLDNSTVTVGFDTATETIRIYFGDQQPDPEPVPRYTLSGKVSASGFRAVLTGSGRSLTCKGGDSYRFEQLEPGDYLLTFTLEGYVTRTYPITLTDSDMVLDGVLTVPGDVSGDGRLNTGDIARIYAHIRGSTLLSGYALDCADFSGDSSVNMGDTAGLYAFVRSQKPPVTPDPPAPPVSGVYVVGEDALPYSDEEIYQQIFDPNTKLQIDLEMSDEELQKLQQDYERYRNMGSKSPIYRLGDLTLTVTTAGGTVSYVIKEVGARMKGNTSRTSFYNENEGIYKYIHFKFDFQETFDDEDYYGSDCKVWENKDARKARKNRTFATLEKLEMRWNKLYDATYLKESYAYDIYRSEGVLAPQCNIGVLTWSGARMGIYTVQEPVDNLFIQRNLPEADQGGDLYKLGWTSEGATFTNTNSIGAEDEDKGKFYVYDIKTNKKTTTHEDLIRMIQTLNSGNVTKDSFASVVEVDNFLRFAAVSYFMGNPDDLRNNYNNCYVYFLKSSGKAVFIPYDYDRCLGINREWNPSGHSMTKDSPYGQGNQQSPLFRFSVDEGGFYQKEYTNVLLEVAENELLSPESFEARFCIAAAHYADQVTPERNLKNAEGRDFSFDLERSGSASGGSNLSFQDYITAKMDAFRGFMGQSNPGSRDCYLRGDFNNWALESRYAMRAEGNVLTYTLRVRSSAKFKVFDNQDGTWMGAECVSPDSDAVWEADGHTNIVLSSGSWKITYDPDSRQITVTNA